MSSKVGGLREDLIREIGFYSVDHDKGGTDNLFNAIDAFASGHHAEGVAEGAAEEREKIRRMQLCGRRVQVSQFPDDERRNLRIETDVDGVAYTLVPASVLAPPEQEKIARLSEIVADMSAEEPPAEIITRAGTVLAPTKGSLVTPEELAYMKREIELHEDYELNVGKKSDKKEVKP